MIIPVYYSNNIQDALQLNIAFLECCTGQLITVISRFEKTQKTYQHLGETKPFSQEC